MEACRGPPYCEGTGHTWVEACRGPLYSKGTGHMRMEACWGPCTLPLQNSSLVRELWGFIWALRRPPASSWVPQGPYSQGASERGCLEQVDVQRVSRTRPQDAFLPHGALGPAGLCLCPEEVGRPPPASCRPSLLNQLQTLGAQLGGIYWWRISIMGSWLKLVASPTPKVSPAV